MTPAQQVLKLLDERLALVQTRNGYVDRPFFLFRLALRRKVAAIDEAIARIDARIRRAREESTEAERYEKGGSSQS